jgi:hypothetical protein
MTAKSIESDSVPDDMDLPMFPSEFYMSKKTGGKVPYIEIGKQRNSGILPSADSNLVNLNVLKAAGIIPCAPEEDWV